MPHNLRRQTGRGDLHFINFCCYQRRAFLCSEEARNIAVQLVNEVRQKYGFALLGYVFMPEHVHLLISESGSVPPSIVVQVFKQRVSRHIRGAEPVAKNELAIAEQDVLRFWQRRYYDFNIHTIYKLTEKLDYMHKNPVTRKLVAHPKDWPWSSWAFYAGQEALLQMDVWV